MFLFLFAPFYGYSKIWTDIELVTTPTILNNMTSNPFGWNEFIATPRLIVNFENYDREAVSTYKALDSTAKTGALLLLSFFLYALAAWYLNQVVPSVQGFARPWYFLFTKSYWTGRVDRKLNETAGERDVLLQEKELSGSTGSVRIRKLTKQYAGNTAVKEFSATFESGKVYALLGYVGTFLSHLFICCDF
jgi:hypothetical protein